MSIANNKLSFSEELHSFPQKQALTNKVLFTQKQKGHQNENWLPNAKTTLSAAGVLITLGASYLSYQRYANPPSAVPLLTLNPTDIMVVAVCSFLFFDPFAIFKKSNNEMHVNKFLKPIPDEPLNEIEPLKDNESISNYNLFIDKLNKVPLPLSDDLKDVVQSLEIFIDNKLSTSTEVFEDSDFVEMLDNAFTTLLKVDKQSALEIIKKYVTQQYDENFVENKCKKNTPKQLFIRGIVLETLLDSEIGLDLAIDCLEKLNVSYENDLKNKVDKYNYKHVIKSAVINIYKTDASRLIKFMEKYEKIYEVGDPFRRVKVGSSISGGLRYIVNLLDEANATNDERLKAKKILVQIADVLIKTKDYSEVELLLLNIFDASFFVEIFEHVSPALENNLIDSFNLLTEKYEKYAKESESKEEKSVLRNCILF